MNKSNRLDKEIETDPRISGLGSEGNGLTLTGIFIFAGAIAALAAMAGKDEVATSVPETKAMTITQTEPSPNF